MGESAEGGADRGFLSGRITVEAADGHRIEPPQPLELVLGQRRAERGYDLAEARLLALDTIQRTPALDWIVVTKRPQNIPRMMPEQWKKAPLRNLWLLVTIEGPDYYWRWHQLAKVRAAVRGISYEPALGPLSIDAMGAVHRYEDWEGDPSIPHGTRRFTVADHIQATAGVECRKDADVIDETPMAYKPIDAVMQAQEDLVEVVQTLRQVVCVKG